MSRCYPFPPPGYVRKEIRDKCLIDSIKGAKEEEVKKDRKHKRKEKKRKESKKHRHKRQRKDEGDANASGKIINSEVEFLEKSCLTAELELQTSSQNSCDSTLHSNERPKQIQSQPLDETSTRIRLPDKGQKDPEAEVMMTNKDQKQRFSQSQERLDASQAAAPKESVGRLYSTPRDALRVCQEKRRDNRKMSKEKMPSSLSSCTHPEQEKPSSSSHQETIKPSKLLCSKCPPSMSTQFLNLIENWAPDRVESKLTDSEDQEWWLFIKFDAKRQQVCNQKTTLGSSSMLWPSARFLPEVEVHALPFTVPF